MQALIPWWISEVNLLNNKYRINYFNFRRFQDKYLLTNDAGEYVFLDNDAFQRIINKEMLPGSVFNELKEKHLIFDTDEAVFVNEYKNYIKGNKRYLFGATSLHIFVLNNECNMGCIYCQAKDEETISSCYMSKETAEKCVDIALSSPARALTFEFQGGEPLLNFDTLKHIVEYSQQKKGGKHIEYNLVTNLTVMTDEMRGFLIKNGVGICTSIDGPKRLHDINRPFLGGSGSYDKVKAQIDCLVDAGVSLSAIQTTTRYSLEYAREIIDEYCRLGQRELFIRPLTRLGTAEKKWDVIGYTAEEFLSFYRECVDYIIQLNKSGTLMREKHAVLFLKKILSGVSDNYMELRSPCGASVGQIAYYADGNIFTCDEGRMLYEMGDGAFKLGNAYENTYDEMMQSPVCKSVCIASLLEGQLTCSNCVYQPYCGVCPVINLAQEHDIFAKRAETFRCRVYGGMLDYLFELLHDNDEETMKILYSWIGREYYENQ